MGAIRKENLTPEQWSAILKAIAREKELEAERKYAVELKKYEDKLKIRQRMTKAKKDQTDLEDEIFKLYYNGLSKKDVLRLLQADDGTTALTLNDRIERIDTTIRQQQQEIYDEEILKHLESKDDSFYKSNEFTLWASENLDSEGELDVGDGYTVSQNFDFADGNWEDGELEHVKEQYEDYMLSLVANGEDGFLDVNHIWSQIDINAFQNDPEYLTSNQSKHTLGIDLSDANLPISENIIEVLSDVNTKLLQSNLFQTRLNKLESEAYKLGLNNEALLSEEFPELHSGYKSKQKQTKESLLKTVIPELNNNEIQIDDSNIKQLQEEDVNKNNGSIKEFNFNNDTSSRAPSIFMSDPKNPSYASGQRQHPLGTPKIPSKPVNAPKDKTASSPAFAANKTSIDWAKTEGKKWYDKA